MNEEVPTHVLQGLQGPKGEKVPTTPVHVTKVESRASMLFLTQEFRDQSQAITTQVQAMTTQANIEHGLRVNDNEHTMKSWLRDFMGMNRRISLGSKVVGGIPMIFLNEVHKIVSAITSREKTELASYQLKDVAQILYTQ